MSQVNISSYAESEFKSYFEKTNTFNQLKKDYRYVSFTKSFNNDTFDMLYPRGGTVRQIISDPDTVFSVVPFYYIKYIQDIHSDKIYDIGCGWNLPKQYIPNLIGIDSRRHATYVRYDIDDSFNDDFILRYQNQMSAFIAICSLHFYPLSQIKLRIQNALNCLKSGGRAYLTFNIARMIDKDKLFWVHRENNDFEYVEKWIRNELYNPDWNYIVFDLDFWITEDHKEKQWEEALDGNLRMVIEKK